MECTLPTAPVTADSPKDLVIPKVRQKCISRVTEQWAPITVWKKKEDGSGIVPVEHTCWCKGLLLSLKSFNLYGAHSRRRWSPCMRLLQGKENKSQKFNLQMV